MAKLPTMEQMLKAGVHFGHQSSHWHPKMEPYIYTTRNGVHIIDLKKTTAKLEAALAYVSKVVADGGDVQIVGTKLQANPMKEKYAKACKMPYVSTRWVGGTLTNFNAIKLSIQRYVELLRGRDGGDWEKYTKKERSELQKEIDRLHEMFAGLVNMRGIPKAMFVLDIRTEQTAVKEAHVMKVPVVAVCDTNTNPTNIACVIPANDDATHGIELLVKAVAEACEEGLNNRKVVAAPEKKSPFAQTPAPVRKAAPVAATPAVEKVKTE
ncbi:MAG: 30S ribosomal protein S2 [Parcubacteria group bacterium]|nr:30S ribosomal protein S2 [Parcubacteria group bacterium]